MAQFGARFSAPLHYRAEVSITEGLARFVATIANLYLQMDS